MREIDPLLGAVGLRPEVRLSDEEAYQYNGRGVLQVSGAARLRVLPVKEQLDLRIVEEYARPWLPDDRGTIMGSGIVRQLVVDTDDPILAVVAEAQAHYRAMGQWFFHGWNFRRRYSKAELDAAEIFQATFHSVEIAGEDYGTKYDEYRACPMCGCGATQANELVLDRKRLSRRKDFIETLACELVASSRVAEAFQRYEVSGVRFDAMRCAGSDVSSDEWMQLIATSHDARLAPATVAGCRPLEDPNSEESARYRCPLGHRLGLNLISEAFVERSSWDGKDVAYSNEYFGSHQGLLRPRRLIFVSQKVREVIEQEKLRGVTLEVAHLV